MEISSSLTRRSNINIALTLYNYFPFGGLQRDMASIAMDLVDRGHRVTVITTGWQGEKIPNVEIDFLKPKGFSNHARMAAYSARISKINQQERFDIIVGFNKCAGLDMYFAADVCWRNKLAGQWLKHWLPRYHTYLDLEAQTFNNSRSTFLFISSQEMQNYQRFYPIAENQARLLPPGIDRKFVLPSNAPEIRKKFRKEFNLEEKDPTFLFVGSGFKTKGLDRAILSFATLSASNKRFFVIGKDRITPYQKLARKKGVDHQMLFLGGRNDVDRFYLGCDVLLHPARFETAGKVLLEAALSGLYVVTTAACGYADHIKAMACGKVLAEPFQQQDLNQAVLRYHKPDFEKIEQYRHEHDLHGLFKVAADTIEGAV